MPGGSSTARTGRILSPPTEARLLYALLAADGRACTQAELLEAAWGVAFASTTHYLHIYVRYLREKLEVDPRRPRHLRIAWGRGYRLVLDFPGIDLSRPAMQRISD